MWLRTLCLSLFLFLIGSFAEEEPKAKIMGGDTTTISTARYMIQLYIDSRFVCGGSLLRGNVVVTAAHCVNGIKAQQITVKGGATYRSEKGVQRGVKYVFVPQLYSPNTLFMDVAVLILKTQMVGDNIRIVTLRTTNVDAGLAVRILGWGRMDTGQLSNQLRSTNLKSISDTECEEYYPGMIQNTMMCAMELGKDACNGDSGGPLLIDNQLTGIVSWGYACSRVYPSVYTDVTAPRVSTFITNIITNYA